MSISYRPDSQADLVEIAVYLTQRSPATAARFESAVQLTFERLELLPGLGRVFSPPNANLPGLRSWPVTSFAQYVVFYRPVDDGILIVRILHHARDAATIIAAEE